MSDDHTIRLSSRKLGDYLGLSASLIESALERQSENLEEAGEKRLGEILVAFGEISPEDLANAIQAQRVDRLRACPLFSHLDPAELSTLADGFEEVSMPAGEQFVTQDDQDPYLYILANGLLEVFHTNEEGEETRLAVVYPGEPIGEMNYFAPGTRSASVRALETSHLLRMDYGTLTEFFEAFPNVASAFIDVVTRRLRQTNLLYQENQSPRTGIPPGLGHLGEFIDFTDAFSLESGIEGLIERLVHSASQLTDADRASLFLIDRDTEELWSMVAEGPDVHEIRVPSDRGIVGWVAQHKKLVNIADAYEDDRFNRDVDKRTGYRTRTILCAPVWDLKGEVLGVVQVINKRSALFNEDDENLLRAFCEQAAVAVENFNHYRKVRRSHERLAIMLDVATAISRCVDPRELVAAINGRISAFLKCDQGSCFVLERDVSELWTVRADEDETETVRISARASLAGHCATRGELVRLDDAYEDPRFDREQDRKSGYRTRSVLCVPVLNGDSGIAGVLQAVNKFEGPFTDDDLDLLRAISAQLGLAARLHAETASPAP